MSVAEAPTPLDREVASRGYVTRRILDDESVARLRAAHDALGVERTHAFFSSNVHASRADAVEVDRLLKEVMGPRLRQLLPGHEPFLGAFISKGAEAGGEVELHQDWTYTDERVARAVLVWVPLCDVDETNGALRVVEGSHRWTTGIRPMVAEQPTRSCQAVLVGRATPVPLRAGEGLVYDPALVHGSPPNLTDRVRPAAAVALAPAGADIVHFRCEGEALRGYRVTSSFFTELAFGEPPRGCPPIQAWATAVAPGDFELRCRADAGTDPEPGAGPPPARPRRYRWLGARGARGRWRGPDEGDVNRPA